jgi:riboflavin synthase
MFTGIIEDLGTVRQLSVSSIQVASVLDDIRIGDSIAVNGVCLTVTRLCPGQEALILDFDVSPETLSRTGLGRLNRGEKVNLERALKIGGRLGGHFLSGHIEEVGKILQVRPAGNSVLYSFSSGRELNRYIVPKGSVALDGVSLTVASVAGRTFSIALIPSTLENTTLITKPTGAILNLETDILVKAVMYRQQQMSANPDADLKAALERSGFLG